MSEKELGPKTQDVYRVIDGVKIPVAFEHACGRPLEEHMKLLKEFNIRPDDVLIAAFGKAGTHWIWEVTCMLFAGKAEYEKRTKEFAMMEATEIEKLESQPSPRIFNSHLPMHILPKQIKEKKAKVIHVYRNCKDTLVSGYFHIRQMPGAENITLEQAERALNHSEVPAAEYISYMKLMDDYKKNNPDIPFFTMSFEDTKEDPQKAIQKLADFLGVEASPQLIQDIAEATSFTKMREADKTKQQKDKLPYVQMYRKGQVGDWKNYMTVAQSESLDAAMNQLQLCDYHFRYTL